MKRSFALFFLIVLSLPALYKVGLVSFYQLNKEYIAENYCVNKERPMTMCYGKCFLDRGMELVDKMPSPKSITAQLKLENVDFLGVEIFSTITLPEKALSFSGLPTPSVSDGVSSFVFRPPLV